MVPKTEPDSGGKVGVGNGEACVAESVLKLAESVAEINDGVIIRDGVGVLVMVGVFVGVDVFVGVGVLVGVEVTSSVGVGVKVGGMATTSMGKAGLVAPILVVEL